VGAIIEFNDLKAPEPLDGTPPWQDPQWLAAAEDWIEAECGRAARTRIGPAWGRGRPYSVVARVPTASGTVWFKANPPAARFEPALLVALADWHPDRFAAPIAVDLDRAWSLTRDGGVTLRADQPRAPEASTWPEVLRGYARLQADTDVLTASYLSPWLEAGYGQAAVDRSLFLALRIAPLARALTWGRLFPCYLGHPAPAVHAARALAALLEPDPLASA